MIKKSLYLVIFILAVASLAAMDENKESEPVFPPHAILNASYCGDMEMVKKILATNPDKDIRDAIGDTALHVAVLQQNIMVVKLLLDNGFDPNAKATKTGCTPLHLAVAANNAAAARLLLQYGADKRIRCLEGLTPMDRARQGEKRALISVLM